MHIFLIYTLRTGFVVVFSSFKIFFFLCHRKKNRILYDQRNPVITLRIGFFFSSSTLVTLICIFQRHFFFYFSKSSWIEHVMVLKLVSGANELIPHHPVLSFFLKQKKNLFEGFCGGKSEKSRLVLSKVQSYFNNENNMKKKSYIIQLTRKWQAKKSRPRASLVVVFFFLFQYFRSHLDVVDIFFFIERLCLPDFDTHISLTKEKKTYYHKFKSVRK